MTRERCSNCETKVNEDEKYCQNCGENVDMQRLMDVRQDDQML